MLLEFTVCNFRSFAEEQTLSLVASDQKAVDPAIDEANRIDYGEGRFALRSAVIYGANASGKSNLFGALHALRTLVVSPFAKESGEPLPVEPFKLRNDTRDEPTEFEVVFRHAGQQYRYGIEVDEQQVHAEWLTRLDGEREVSLFERDEQAFTLADELKSAESVTARTRKEKAFLAVASEFNVELAASLVEWFRSIGLIDATNDQTLRWTASQVEENSPLAAPIKSFVRRLDLGIQDLAVTASPVNLLDQLKGSGLGRAGFIYKGEASSEWVKLDVLTQHAVYEGEKKAGIAHFSLFEHESGGTQKLFSLAGPVLDVIRRGGLLFIDEFGARLHPLLTQALLALFRSDEARSSGAQIVVFTHETHLMDHRTSRRDQLWMVEKNRRGESRLYSLASLKGVRNDERFERRYLDGRYGGVPFPGHLPLSIDEMAHEKGDEVGDDMGTEMDDSTR